MSVQHAKQLETPEEGFAGPNGDRTGQTLDRSEQSFGRGVEYEPSLDSATAGLEPLLAFPSELASEDNGRPAWLFVVVGAIAATLCFATFQVVQSQWLGGVSAEASGSLTVETRPAGADVLVDGLHRGVTPLTVSLNPGAHALIVRNGGDERAVPLSVTAGGSVAQYFEMSPAGSSAALGTVSVTTSPAGARVSIDGEPRGVSPLTVGGLAAGQHRIVVTNETASATRVVSVQGGSATSVVFSMEADAGSVSGAVGGWLTVATPFEVQVMEGGEVVGLSTASRIMLPAGRHDLVLVNQSLEYSGPMTVDIGAGRVTTLRVDPPRANVSINARPWADVFIDDVNAGQTPIANLPLPIGTHRVVFRHPQLGEQQRDIVVTAQSPNRLSIDLTR